MKIIPQWQKSWRYHAAVRERIHIVPAIPPVIHPGSQQPVTLPNPSRIAKIMATQVNGRTVPDIVSTAGWIGPFQFSLVSTLTSLVTGLSGRFLWVVDSTPGAAATATFDDSPAAWPLFAGAVIPWPKPGYSNCYLSCTAQAGASMTLASAFDVSLLSEIQSLNS